MRTRYISILVALIVAITSISINGKVFAYNEFYSSNDILFYDENDTGCPSGLTATQLSGSDNRQKIYNFWISQGLTPAQSAGIVGNIQSESGFSPFRQEDSKTWPDGGYGIAQFTGGQRAAVTKYLSEKLGNTFAQYYLNDYGAGVSAANNFVPNTIPQTINDSFLLGELNYLAEYTAGFSPNTIQIRVDGLKNDYGITIPFGVKLLEFIKTLPSASDAAKAWIYLYEQPGNIKLVAAARAASAEQILTSYAGANGSTNDCSTVGIGGLTFDQAKKMMKAYYNNRTAYFNVFWNTPGYSNQCTAFSYYFNTRFITAGTGRGDGKNVVSNLISDFPNYYKSTTKDDLQPFSVFSLTNNSAGHTGVILGIQSDGSVIIGEANIDTSKFNQSSGLTEVEVTGTKSDTTRGIVAVEHWKNINSWINSMADWNLEDPTFASPINNSDITNKVQDSL